MSSAHNMSDPVCLVENNNEQLSVNQEAIRMLEQISEPVVVVAVVGLHRTGKSYLMNRLAGQNHGFSLGSTVQSTTKGIWMWCMSHPTKPNQTLVLLDTEGLGDVEKGDPKNDTWIFALAVLLSSTLVYNSMSTINHQALEQLHYVAELTELIRAKSSSKSDGVADSTEFVSFFPDFIWTVRDFTLELKLRGEPILEDEYLKNALKLIPGQNFNAQKANQPRECIRNFFPKRKCFVFGLPTNDKELLCKLESVSENQLDLNFLQQTCAFCSYIFTQSKIKTLRENTVVTGNRLATLVETYVNTISTGAIPCLENAVTALAQQENSAAVQQAAEHYSQQMAQRVQLPTDTLQELLAAHAACEKEAIAVFMERSFKDENQEFQKELVKILAKKKEELLLRNEEASAQYCQSELDRISEPLREGMSAGDFSVPGGHQLYMEIRRKIDQDYWQVPKKGVKAGEVFRKFLWAQTAIQYTILKSDRALIDVEKATAVEQAKKEAAEKERELLTQKLQEARDRRESQEGTYKENMEQLQKKLTRERDQLLREQEMMLDHQMKIQKDLTDEGFERKAEAMNTEIRLLEDRINATENDINFFEQAFRSLGEGIISVSSAPNTLIDQAIKVFLSLVKYD